MHDILVHAPTSGKTTYASSFLQICTLQLSAPVHEGCFRNPTAQRSFLSICKLVALHPAISIQVEAVVMARMFVDPHSSLRMSDRFCGLQAESAEARSAYVHACLAPQVAAPEWWSWLADGQPLGPVRLPQLLYLCRGDLLTFRANNDVSQCVLHLSHSDRLPQLLYLCRVDVLTPRAISVVPQRLLHMPQTLISFWSPAVAFCSTQGKFALGHV